MNERIKTTKRKINVRRAIFIYGGLAWAIAHFLVFWVYVNAGTLVSSFFKTDINGNMVFNGLKAYGEVFEYMFGMRTNSMISQRSMWNSISILLLSLVINLPITLLFSYMIYRKIRFHAFLRIGIYVPCVLSTVILCLFYKIMVSGEATFYSIFTVLKALGYKNEYVIQNGVLSDANTAWGAVIVFSIWTGVNGNIIYFNSAMARLPDSVLESAELDGASQMRQFISIVLPMIWPTITTMSITLIGGSLTWFQPAQLLIGETMAAQTKTGTIAWIIVCQVRAGATAGFTTAFGVVISILAGAFVVFFRWAMDKLFKEEEY